jgi:hypothetical protein
MRYYGFGNYYLSSLQQGLQAHHVCVEMFNKYNTQPAEGTRPANRWNYLDDWAKNHKTIVLLNGGNSSDLAAMFNFLVGDTGEGTVHDYPFAKFREDEQSLNSALTSIGIVLPPKIYDTAAEDRASRNGRYQERGSTILRHGRPTLTEWEEELIVRLNQYGLAK